MNLRKVGSSVKLVVPAAMLDFLRRRAGAMVGLSIDGGRLVIEPRQRPHYTLEKLLAQGSASRDMTDEERDWLETKPVGAELL